MNNKQGEEQMKTTRPRLTAAEKHERRILRCMAVDATRTRDDAVALIAASDASVKAFYAEHGRLTITLTANGLKSTVTR